MTKLENRLSISERTKLRSQVTPLHCLKPLKRLCYQADGTHYYIGILFCSVCKKQFREMIEEIN